MPVVSIAAVFLSSLLLFLIQPIVAKAILPEFGGAAGVWTTCMLFFQVGLLLGYAYVHWTARLLRPRAQVALHLFLLIASVVMLPIKIPPAGGTTTAQWPMTAILALLTSSVGLPYFLLTTTGPLVQFWYARTSGALPYWLFAVSNFASLAGLLAYPFAIEPWLGQRRQLQIWSFGYAAFSALVTWFALKSKIEAVPPARSQAPNVRQRLLWIALAATPSALWLAVANQMSQTVAPVPLLWILPLSIYLITLVLSFHRDQWYRPELLRWAMPVAVVAIIAATKQYTWSNQIVWGLLLFLLALFVCALFCHGELARHKPTAEHLTSFYLMVALGGAMGAVFVSVVAPLAFSSYIELPVAMVGCGLLALPLLYGYSSTRRLARLSIVAVAALAISVSLANRGPLRGRNFYGVLEVREDGIGSNAYRALYNGAILHGSEFAYPKRSRVPTTYYSHQSGVGRELEGMSQSGRRIGVIGLGVGTIAAYAEPGDFVRFYEINPLVIHVARKYFRFLNECRGAVEIVAGDARLALARESPQQFDLLAVDAFSGDAVPIHLLTREAFELYFRHLRASGVLAVHVTSKYLNLAPVVTKIAAALGRNSELRVNAADPLNQVSAAAWVIIKGRRPVEQHERIWTDDYTNLLEVLK